jgi:hypothetical protein
MEASSMKAMPMRSTLLSLVISLFAMQVVGCEDPERDFPRRDGGAAPDPLGVFAGSVLYLGPRPNCSYLADGTANAVIGNAVLLLFDYDNPPPPAGSASSSLNLLAINGRDLFSIDDCMPLVPMPSDLVPISRTLNFVWPEIPLGDGPQNADGTYPGRSYQIRGFYDRDGDFLPFFTITNLTTAGDIGGGAVVDPTAAIPVFQRLSLGHYAEHPDGQRLSGISVTLASPIATERPIFELSDSTRGLSSEATIPLVADSLAREEALYQATTMRVELILDATHADGDRTFALAMARAGMGDFDFRPLRHGLPIFPVDANADGMQDPHPILGSSGVPWYGPMMILRRARSPLEVAARIPDILFIATVRPSRVIGADQGFVPRETFARPEFIVPPIAVMVTNPRAPGICRVPIIAPGNIAELYESQTVVDCQELPTGNYDVNVLSGLAGATAHDLAAECATECVAGGEDPAVCMTSCATYAALRSETGVRFSGGVYSSQAWAIPNDLGCPDLSYRPTALNQLDPANEDGSFLACSDPGASLLVHQGRDGGFSVVEPDPATAGDPEASGDGHGVATCTSAFHTAGPMAGTVGPVAYQSFPEAFVGLCCEPVRHLCGVPLCDARTSAVLAGYPDAVRAGGDGTVRSTREIRLDAEVSVEDGVTLPRCVPFLPPAQCCDGV